MLLGECEAYLARGADSVQVVALHGNQATRLTLQRAVGSVSGSPWTKKKSAGPPSTIRPAVVSPSRSPPRAVADASASHGSRPASTSASTSHARWFARRDPPPKSVPVALCTPPPHATR